MQKNIFFNQRKQEQETNLGLGRGGTAEITHVNLAALCVHHHSHSKSFLFIEASDLTDDLAVPLVGAVAHVDPRDIHPANGEGLDLLRGAGGRADGAHQLRPPSAPEPVLLELRLGDFVYVDGRRRGAIKRDDAEIGRRGGGRAHRDRMAAARAWKGVAEGSHERNGGGELRGHDHGGLRREEAEGLSHLFVAFPGLRSPLQS